MPVIDEVDVPVTVDGPPATAAAAFQRQRKRLAVGHDPRVAAGHDLVLERCPHAVATVLAVLQECGLGRVGVTTPQRVDDAAVIGDGVRGVP